MLKKSLLLIVALLTIGGSTIAAAPVVPAEAATHHVIKWHGKKYRSKYTVKQMRRKFHLKYYKTKDIAHVTWVHNRFLGISKGANVHTGAGSETHAHGAVTHKGHYAMFMTDQLDGGNAYSLEYINLKTGKHYHDQA
ncbi:hypothetical protein ACFQ44_13605 [Levilactobacillus lanxiensis]|uniref:Uncharacterized protein n=1 Tax=Levilactobacillus lanxiensis TaxID=2799568 RepID=A0ABW4D7Z1_9LACO|nr:hypothetical protein [Levilactobacillus lanxiensis]